MQTPTHKPIPDDATVHRRTIIAVVVAVVLVVGVVGASWWAFGRPKPQVEQKQTAIEQVPETSTAESVPPTETAAGASATAEASSSAEASAAATTKPVPRIAFRLGTTLYLANEDGTDAVSMARSSSGPFAASPDGHKLAWVDGQTKTLTIATEGGATVKVSGQAADARPVWTPDSSEIYFRRLDTSSTLTPLVQRVVATGGTPIAVGTGDHFAVGPDGAKVIGPMGTQGNAARTIEFIGNDGRVQIALPGTVSGLALGKDAIYAAVSDPASQAGIWRVGRDGSNMKRLVTGLPKGERGSLTDLLLSPNGATLAFAVTGDDGYSRLYAVPTTGAAPRKLSIRRDGYPTEWTSDSASLLFIEGNQFQGEPTALMRVHPDATARFMIVSGATL